jgi:hypothetical protein
MDMSIPLRRGMSFWLECDSRRSHAEKQQAACHFEISQIEAVVVSSAPAETG